MTIVVIQLRVNQVTFFLNLVVLLTGLDIEGGDSGKKPVAAGRSKTEDGRQPDR